MSMKNPDLFLEGLNPPQREVVLHHEGPVLAAAVAGAGKTTVLVRRMAYMMAKHGVAGEEMLAVTFSKKGADEMNERLEKLTDGSSGARVGTFHSLAYQIVREEISEVKDWAIDDRNKYRYCIKDATGYKGMKWDGADVTLLEDFIAKAKTNLMRPMDDGILELARVCSGGKSQPHRMVEAYFESEELRRQRQLIGFDDMLFDAAELLRDDESVRQRWADKWQFVLQDEAQDQNLGQLLMGELLSKDHKNYMLVGDPAQCHPPGTMISTDDGDVAVEDLWAWQEGQTITVKGWNRNAQKMVGGRATKLGCRPYKGTLFKVRVGTRSVEMTDNHKALCRWTDNKDGETCVTYLMYREGFGYRVGWCQLFASRGDSRNFHLGTRSRIEKADKTWILKTHTGRREASIYESIVAAKYGIPTATFEPVHGNPNLDADAIREIFDAVPPNGGERCLLAHGLNSGLPFLPWPPQENDEEVACRRATYFPVYACNMIPELMSVPLPDDRNMWAPVDSIGYREYDGLVYSLDVEKDHSYAANGIVLLNCIYTWRGAHPEKLLTFEQRWGAKVILMDRNYRCGQRIVDVANKSLAGMDPATKLDMEMICCRTDDKGGRVDGIVTSKQFLDLDDEAVNVVDHVTGLSEDGVSYKDIVFLYRTNAQSRAPEEALLSARIPYRIIGGANFYERREVKCLLGYLRLAAGRGDGEDIRRCINAPFRFLGRAFVDKVMEAADKQEKGDSDFVRAVSQAASRAGVQSRQRRSAEDWADLIHEMEEEIVKGRSYVEKCKSEQGETGYLDSAKPARLLEMILQVTRYTDWLRKDEGEETTQNSRVSNVRELVRAAERFPTVDELLDYIDRNIAESKKQRRSNNQPNKVTLMSIHRSKGMEFPVVFLIGASDGILPHARAEDDGEERRLFYVAATRARDELHVSAVSRVAVGDKIKFLMPSAYLAQAGIPPTKSGMLSMEPLEGDGSDPRDV